jgi:hypothetical protein
VQFDTQSIAHDVLQVSFKLGMLKPSPSYITTLYGT